MRSALVLSIALVLSLSSETVSAQDPTYWVYVASESADEVSIIAFTPESQIQVAKRIPVGFWPLETEGPHGLAISNDGNHWFVTLGHGVPVFGKLLKFRTGADTLVGQVELGLFPATVVVSEAQLAFAVNANFHGDRVPSTVSVVDLPTMVELARVRTCIMPHGSRLSPDQSKHYSVCMMDDQLVELDAYALAVSRRLDLIARSHRAQGSPVAGADHPCTPTWVTPSPDGRRLYVACNRGDVILEIDLDRWVVVRRLAAPTGPYNAEVTPDGRRLVVTQKGSAEVSIVDLLSGKRVTAIPSSRRIAHGVSIEPEGRYAFVSVEGVQGEPGAVDVIDLEQLRKVASIDVGKQAGGIAFWKKTHH